MKTRIRLHMRGFQNKLMVIAERKKHWYSKWAYLDAFENIEDCITFLEEYSSNYELHGKIYPYTKGEQNDS